MRWVVLAVLVCVVVLAAGTVWAMPEPLQPSQEEGDGAMTNPEKAAKVAKLDNNEKAAKADKLANTEKTDKADKTEKRPSSAPSVSLGQGKVTVVRVGRAVKPNTNPQTKEKQVAGGGALQDNSDSPKLASTSQSEAQHTSKPGAKISKIFYINLDHDTQRRDHMEEMLRSTGVPFERVPGVTVRDVRAGKFSHLYPKGLFASDKGDDSQQARSWGSDVAHRRAFEVVGNQSPGLYLVLEDDVHFESGWEGKFAEAWDHVPSDWVIARIGCWGKTAEGDKANEHWFRAERHVSGWDENNAYYYGAHAIVLDPSHAQAALEKMKGVPANLADQFTGDGQLGPSYTTVHSLVHTNAEKWGSSKNRVAGTDHVPKAVPVVGEGDKSGVV